MTTLDQWHSAGRSFQHRGHPIFFRADGEGESALLLIHGFPTASWDWAPLWPALTQRFSHVIAADMIGFGFSAKPRDYDYSLMDQADLQMELLAARGVTRYHILAHDYGVSVAQELIARANMQRGPRLLSVTLLNGGLFPESHRPLLTQKLLLGPLGWLVARLSGERAFARNFCQVFGRDTKPSAAELHDFWRLIAHGNGMRNFHRLIRYIPERRAHRARWVGALQNAKMPLKLINGPDDPVSGAHMAARYAALVPRPDITSLPGIGHYPQVEAPAQVLTAFDAFHAGITHRIGE